MAIDFDEMIRLAEQLDLAQQNLLIHRLRMKQIKDRALAGQQSTEYVEQYLNPTRGELLHDLEILRATPVRPEDSLLGKYANPNFANTSAEEFHAQIRAIATEWEQELDEFSDSES
jgi:hypothetical protein